MPSNSDRPRQATKGHYRRKPTEELTELGQFLDTMLVMSRREQGDKLGVRDDVFSDMVMGDRTPSQSWIKSLGWEAILSQSPEWLKAPAVNAAKYKAIIDKLPKKSPYVMDEPKPGTLDEVFQLAFPGYDRLEQAMALGVLETKTGDAAAHFMRQIATHDFKLSQQLMANHGFRLALEQHCLQHGGDALWREVRDKFDAIVKDRVITAITGGSKSVIQEWSAAVGEVFAKAQVLSGLDAKSFAESIGEKPSVMVHIQHGGWFTDDNQFHDGDKPFKAVDHLRTREIYLRLAEKIYQKQLPALAGAVAGSEQVKIMAALETLFPEIATAPYAKQRPGLVPAP